MTHLNTDYAVPVDTTWHYWASETTTATTASDSVWGYWVDQGTASSTTATWTQWTSNTASGSYVVRATDAWQPVPLTAEQLAALEVKRLEQQKLEAERQAKIQAAKQKAEALLLEHLTDEQERAWREERAIFVTSQSGKRFKIKDGRAHNIFELGPDNVPIREYCVHVQPDIPNADNVLAQKLALEHNEDALLRLANSWPMVNGVRR